MVKELFEYIEASHDVVVELETLLTSHPAFAPESGGDGEKEKCDALEKWLVAQGFSPSQIQHFDAPDSRVTSKIRPNMVLTIPGKSEKSVWCCAHMDVVPVGDLSLWETDPFKVVEKDGKLYGRGVEDNQQGLVSGVLVALALLKNNVVPECTFKLLFMSDEEVGSKYGMSYLIENHLEIFKKEDLILIPDGGDPEGKTIEVAEKSIFWLKVITKGTQCHGSMPNLGKNAMLAGCECALKLHDLENVFNKKDEKFEAPDYSTFSPTKKEANVDTVNIIPGSDVFYMDCRILPCYKLDEVRAEVKKICAGIENKYGVKIETQEVQAIESPSTDVNAPVVKKLIEAIKEVHGIDGKPIGIGGGTVAAELRQKGIDAVVWSTLENTMHQPNENCRIVNVIKDAKTILSVCN